MGDTIPSVHTQDEREVGNQEFTELRLVCIGDCASYTPGSSPVSTVPLLNQQWLSWWQSQARGRKAVTMVLGKKKLPGW